jgi:hypothetical protein
MARTTRFWIVASLTAVLVLSGTTRADEPKKEPEKKDPEKKEPEKKKDEITGQMDLGRLFEMVQRLREAQARKKLAENLRQLQLAQQRQPEDPKKDPNRKPDDPPFIPILPLIEQNNFYSAPFAIPNGPGDRLGLSLEKVGPVLVSQLKLPKDMGRVVGEIKKDSPAGKAGLKQYDILLEINGNAIPASDEEFGKLLPEGKDRKVSLTVLREGQKTALKDVPVAEKPTAPNIKTYYAPSDSLRGWEWNYLRGQTQGSPATRLPRGYEVLSREPVLTTIFREDKRFTVRLQEGSLAITVVATNDGKKSIVEVIKVQEGGSTERYTTLDKVPIEYRDKAARLLQMGEKQPLGSDG